VDPVRSVLSGLEPADVGEETFAQRCRSIWTQNGPRRTDGFLPSTGSRRRENPILCRRGGSQSRGYALFVSGAAYVSGATLVGGDIAFRAFGEVRRIEIVLACDAHKGEEGIASRLGERRPHPTWRHRFGNRTDRPFRRQPLS
jgi:hypothetical protein